MKRQTLLVDGGGTLWEETDDVKRLLEELIGRLEPLGYTAGYLRHVLNERQRRTGHLHGYRGRFGAWLEEAYRSLAGERAQPETVSWLRERVAALERQSLRLLAGVAQTLAALARRHRLILYARGGLAEESAKIERSGLERYFEAVEVAPDDQPRNFAELIERYRIVKANGWMVGDSATEDIVPALQVGLGAVYIPRPGTRAEMAAVEGRLVLAGNFGQLQQIF